MTRKSALRASPGGDSTPLFRLGEQIPDTFVIVFFVAILAALATHLVPAGTFDTQDISYLQDGAEKTRTVLVADSYRLSEDTDTGVTLFEGGGGLGFFNFMFEGLTAGSKWGSAIGVMAFILIVGGAFGVIIRTGAIEQGLKRAIERMGHRQSLFIPVIFTLFALGGAVYGLGEECIAFAMILTPIVVMMGYNAMTAVMITYMASQIGFATSWMNPFSVAVAQGIADVPLLSGAGFRMAMWACFVLVGIFFTMRYAARVKADPARSLSHKADEYWRAHLSEVEQERTEFGIGSWLVIVTFALGIVWVVWGVMAWGYYIPEIATQFFIIGLAAGAIGVAFRLRGMGVNEVAVSFRQGVKDLVPAAVIVGMAKGIVLLLGGDDPTSPSVLNTILHAIAGLFDHLPDWGSAWVMLSFQSMFNFLVSSGSGQAALTMPLMAPLADLAGVTRQVAVLAFQLGDGMTNMLIPTSSALIGTLGVARIDWVLWVVHIWKLALIFFVMSSVAVIGAVMIGYV
ncbi:putative basic amino acid antiporter YfcC [Halomonas binhaiensis]|uniref:Basic amino acid antiporter YfcC n=1 Tax=Halomonas binhaiensis TaxID=2562282 RepID=A0A5C1N8N9_9GAMM|nr:putative basic amino acid antiporter YfcC [Halomonas binhaiensis]QEM80132.1 putative basic amino acid antiporter YfcC [Halomonas binhaiensis]